MAWLGRQVQVMGDNRRPSKYVQIALISRQIKGQFSTLDLTQTISEAFHQFAHSVTTFPSF